MIEKRGKFVVIEGGDGSGKSSVLGSLQKEYREKVVFTREPGGCPSAEAIRNLALHHPLSLKFSAETMFCLMWAARFVHVSEIIRPALEHGLSVVCDRFDGSTFAYQVWASGHRNRLEKSFWDLQKALACYPDMYIFLDVEPEEGLRRRKEDKNQNHLDERPFDFHKKVREGFVYFMKETQNSVSVDANQSLAVVQSQVSEIVRRELLLI